MGVAASVEAHAGVALGVGGAAKALAGARGRVASRVQRADAGARVGALDQRAVAVAALAIGAAGRRGARWAASTVVADRARRTLGVGLASGGGGRRAGSRGG